MDIIILLSIAWIFAFLIFDKLIKKAPDFSWKLESLEDENRKYFQQAERLTVELENKNKKNWELWSEIERERQEKNEFIWKNKQMFAELTSYREKNANMLNESSELKKRLNKFDSDQERREKDFETKVSELENARKSLDDEKLRIRREDEQKIQMQEAERDRMWNEHEIISVSRMKEVCQKWEFWFSFHDNTSLPESFDGSLKPDFLVEFLWQYIVFDAKMSRSANLQNYISDQVKNTAKKIKLSKNKDDVYKTVFFIIPTIEIASLKKTCFYEEWFSFFIVSIEWFEPILSIFKKLQDYDLADSFDPHERENIVNIIAAFDFHINRRNSIDIISSIEWLKISALKNNLDSQTLEQIDIKKKKMRIEKLKDTEMKRFIHNPEEQLLEIRKLVIPEKAQVKWEDLVEGEDAF